MTRVLILSYEESRITKYPQIVIGGLGPERNNSEV